MQVISNARIWTGVPSAPMAEALAHEHGRIVAIGRDAAVLSAAGPRADVWDAEGATLVPGFIDAHHHLSLSVVYAGTVDCRPTAVRSITDIVARLRAASAGRPPGEWILGYGYDNWQLAEQRHPTREELDAACPEHPVALLHFGFHELVANGRALAAAGITRDTPDPTAGTIRRTASGEPTGHLLETAIGPVETRARRSWLTGDRLGFASRLRQLQQAIVAVGLTRLADPSVSPDEADLYRQVRESGDLTIPLVMMPVSGHGYLTPPHDRLAGPPTGEGPEDFRIGPMKLVFDGGDTCAICLSPKQAVQASLAVIRDVVSHLSLAPLGSALRGRLRWGRDGRLHSGALYYPDLEAAEAMARAAVSRGFSLAIHAMGNEAVAQAAAVISAVAGQHPATIPPRIEHAMIIDRTLAGVIADTGAMAVVQPAFVQMPGTATMPRLPGLQVLGLKTLQEAGVSMAGSSDAPVFGFDPLDGLRAAVLRRTCDGKLLHAEEALDVETVLAMYTREAARAIGSLKDAGTLEVGKRADVVVLSADPFDPGNLPDLHVRRTLLAGRTVYERPTGTVE